jgi:hypothetical protein
LRSIATDIIHDTPSTVLISNTVHHNIEETHYITFACLCENIKYTFLKRLEVFYLFKDNIFVSKFVVFIPLHIQLHSQFNISYFGLLTLFHNSFSLLSFFYDVSSGSTFVYVYFTFPCLKVFERISSFLVYSYINYRHFENQEHFHILLLIRTLRPRSFSLYYYCHLGACSVFRNFFQ